MKRFTVICHRCGKSTFVDLSKTVSDQRCRACRGFLQGVDVSIGDKPKTLRRKMVWKMAGAARQEPVWTDQMTPVIPIRQRWPRFYRWSVLGGLAVFLSAIGWSAYMKFHDSIGGHREVFGQAAPAKIDPRDTMEWNQRALAVARKVISAPTADDLLPLLLHPDVSDDIIRRYYEKEEKLPLGKDLVEEPIIPPGEYNENAVSFQFFDLNDRPRAFALIEKADGSMKVDWPSLVGLGEMPLKEYMETTPKRSVVLRARARLGHYYNGAFSDSKKWLSVRLSNVIDEDVIHAYVDRSLPLADSMEKLLPDLESARAGPDKPVIVLLKYPPENVKPDQTVLSAIFTMSWYKPGGLKPLIEYATKADAEAAAARKNQEKPKDAPDSPKAPDH
ncbi:MAG TPA: hypothetical protein VG796_26620 [Verrucomicrobiales bacterium]|jgi:hypothetical protein|nr:hypothetical protein [Verrucomicrobiales bacterium]